MKVTIAVHETFVEVQTASSSMRMMCLLAYQDRLWPEWKKTLAGCLTVWDFIRRLDESEILRLKVFRERKFSETEIVQLLTELLVDGGHVRPGDLTIVLHSGGVKLGEGLGWLNNVNVSRTVVVGERD